MEAAAAERLSSENDALREDMECIFDFFECLNREVSRIEIASSPHKLLFRIGSDYNWIVTTGVGAERLMSQASHDLHPDCILTTDITSMAQFCRGQLRPMAAIMSGRLTIIGDRRAFGTISAALRSAVKSIMNTYCENNNLLITIPNTFEESDAVSGALFTIYLVRTIDPINNASWDRGHRFSEFVKLRNDLIKKGFSNVPKLPKTGFWRSSTDAHTVQQRKADLIAFLHKLIFRIGYREKIIADFLGYNLIDNYVITNKAFDIATHIAQRHIAQYTISRKLFDPAYNILYYHLTAISNKLILHERAEYMSQSFFTKYCISGMYYGVTGLLVIILRHLLLFVQTSSSPLRHIALFPLLVLLTSPTFHRRTGIASLVILLLPYAIEAFQSNTTITMSILHETYLLPVLLCIMVGAAIRTYVCAAFSLFERRVYIYFIAVTAATVTLLVRILPIVTMLSETAITSYYAAIEAIAVPVIVSLIVDLGGLFTKIGQYFGNRSDMLSPLWISVLAELSDCCEPVSEHVIRTTIERNLNGRLEDIFESFDGTPISSASIAQVHSATVRVNDMLVDVVVKVQHENIAALIVLLEFLRRWKVILLEETDFTLEAKNLAEVGVRLDNSGLLVEVPKPMVGLITKEILVMTKLRGFKICDRLGLQLHQIDSNALMVQVCHCFAYLILVAADPNIGNLFCVESSSDLRRKDWCPGLLDWGATIRRHAYCKLIIAITKGNIYDAILALSQIGFQTNQSEKYPERDVEFFEYIFRDVKARRDAQRENTAYQDIRSNQYQQDVLNGEDECMRYILHAPHDFYFLLKTLSMLRGLMVKLGVQCPLLHIFSLNAHIGIVHTNGISR